MKKLKKELGEVRAQLNKHLGREKNQCENPFKVGEQVIIRLQPQELGSKLAAKWKGPFTVIKIPNRFQIEYKEGNVKKSSHISYVKKFYGRHWFISASGQYPQNGSCHTAVVMSGRLRLAPGNTRQERRRRRCIVSSMEEIIQKGHLLSGPVSVAPVGAVEDLSEDLQAVVTAAGPHGVIQGRELLDLCGQRSCGRGSDCDDAAAVLVAQDLHLSEDSQEDNDLDLTHAEVSKLTLVN